MQNYHKHTSKLEKGLWKVYNRQNRKKCGKAWNCDGLEGAMWFIWSLDGLGAVKRNGRVVCLNAIGVRKLVGLCSRVGL